MYHKSRGKLHAPRASMRGSWAGGRPLPAALYLVERHGENGQGLVEFALVIPLFLLLLFATIYMGLLMKTHSAFEEAVQQAGRVAASAGNAGDADQQMLNALVRTLTSENLTTIGNVTVYDATVSGAPVNNTAQTAYTYLGGNFVCAGTVPVQPPTACPSPATYWNPLTRSTVSGNLDYIGLRVIYQFKSPAGIFPTLQLSANTVTSIEPDIYRL